MKAELDAGMNMNDHVIIAERVYSSKSVSYTHLDVYKRQAEKYTRGHYVRFLIDRERR